MPGLGMSTQYCHCMGPHAGWVYCSGFCLGFTADVSACSGKGTNNMTKRASVHVHIFMRGDTYVDIFCRVPHEWAWDSTIPEGFSIPTPNQSGWDMGVAYFGRGPCVDLDFHNTQGPLSPRHPKTGCAPCPLIACMCVQAVILITEVYGYLLRGLSAGPRSTKTRADLWVV